jgi:hypothetical protein
MLDQHARRRTDRRSVLSLDAKRPRSGSPGPLGGRNARMTISAEHATQSLSPHVVTAPTAKKGMEPLIALI